MKIILLSILAVAMIGLMIPSVFAEVNGLREGQWVKYKVELVFSASSPETEVSVKQVMMDNFLSGMQLDFDYDPTNVEWVKKVITGIDGNYATVSTTSYSLDGIQTETTNRVDVSKFSQNSISIPTDTTFGDTFDIDSKGVWYCDTCLWAPLSVFEIKNSSEDYLFENRKLPNFDYIFLTSDKYVSYDLDGNYVDTNAYLKFEKSTGMLIESDIGWVMEFNDGEWATVYFLLSPIEMSLDGTSIPTTTTSSTLDLPYDVINPPCVNELTNSLQVNLELFIDGTKADIPALVMIDDRDGSGFCYRVFVSDEDVIHGKWIEGYPLEIGHFLWLWDFPLKDMDLDKSKISVNGKMSPQFINTVMQDGDSFKAEFFLKPEPEPETTKPEGGGCLIATAAFGSEMAPQVQFLRELRDNTVLQTQAGTSFMTGFNQFYYSFSPAVADYERENPMFKEAVKITLTPLLTSLTILNYVDIDTEQEMLGYGVGVILLNIGMYFVAPAVVIISLKKRFKF